MKNYFRNWLLLCVAMLILSSCTFATVRTIEEDRAAKEGFNADRYVASIWER